MQMSLTQIRMINRQVNLPPRCGSWPQKNRRGNIMPPKVWTKQLNHYHIVVSILHFPYHHWYNAHAVLSLYIYILISISNSFMQRLQLMALSDNESTDKKARLPSIYANARSKLLPLNRDQKEDEPGISSLNKIPNKHPTLKDIWCIQIYLRYVKGREWRCQVCNTTKKI